MKRRGGPACQRVAEEEVVGRPVHPVVVAVAVEPLLEAQEVGQLPKGLTDHPNFIAMNQYIFQCPALYFFLEIVAIAPHLHPSLKINEVV